MDTEAVERSIQEATASVHENITLVERSLVNLEDHSRYALLYLLWLCTSKHALTINGICQSMRMVYNLGHQGKQQEHAVSMLNLTVNACLHCKHALEFFNKTLVQAVCCTARHVNQMS